jgi:short subunit dehydrogenase-like uncharacterized protein
MLGTRGWTREDGELRRQTSGSAHRTVRLASGKELHAVAFPSGEVITGPRHVNVRTLRGWLVMGATLARVTPFLAPAFPVVIPALRPLLERLATRADDPTAEARHASRFTIRVEIEDAGGERRALEVRGRDPYGLTAVLAVRGARRLLDGPPSDAGVIAPAQLLDPESLLDELRGEGVEVVRDPVW